VLGRSLSNRATGILLMNIPSLTGITRWRNAVGFEMLIKSDLGKRSASA